jgi:tRNA(Ile)-lysidine synthase
MKWEKERYAVISKAREAIRHWRMFEPGDLVLVAVSGGGDSLVLLDVLAQLAEEERINLRIVHVDHGLRPESGDEAKFVERVGGCYGLQCKTVKVEIPVSRSGLSISPEEAAREARYRAFEEELAGSGAVRLATGHTADDRVETLLLRMISGAGPLGLGSIPPVRPPYIRPLIRVWKKEVNDYVPFLPFAPLQDPSNLDLSIPRNRIRYELLPMLEEEYNPSIKRVLLREVETLVSLGDMLGSLAEQAEREDISAIDRGVEISVERLRSRPLAVRRQLIARCLRNLGLEPRFDLVEDIRQRLLEAQGNLSLDLGPDMVARSSYGRLTLGHPPPEAIPVGEMVIPGPGLYSLPGLGLQLEVELCPRGDKDPKHDSGGPHIAWLDADRLSFPLKVRGIRPGDRFHPLGVPGHKKLQDFLVDLKVPREERSRVAMLESGGKIAWVLGLRIDDRFKVVEGTSSVAVLSIR